MTAGRRNDASLSKHWGTPEKYVRAAKMALGGSIDLDPCSNKWSCVGAKTEWSLPETDGLSQKWNFTAIYVNPPYGADRERGTTIKHWLKKCAEASDVYGAAVIALVPVAVNTRHWKDFVWPKASGICFLYDTRLRFLENGEDTGKGAPMACAVVYWGDNLEGFANAFADFGAVVDLKFVRVPTYSQALLGQAHLALEGYTV